MRHRQTLLRNAARHGAAAKARQRGIIVTPAFERIVEANILLSGIGFESAGLASAHSIHNGLTALAETHAYYHGEKVAFGVLTGLQLTDAPPDEIGTVYSFCEDVGLPTTLADIGLGDVDRDADAGRGEGLRPRAVHPSRGGRHHSPRGSSSHARIASATLTKPAMLAPTT